MTNTNTFTLSGFYGENTNTGKVTVSNPANERQVKYYKDLCEQKSVEVDPNHLSWDSNKISTEIKRLLAMQSVWSASKAQIKLIEDICTRCSLPIPDTSKLTGGREGTASQLIQKLQNIEKMSASSIFATDKQIEFLMNMLLCPDCESQEMWADKQITQEEASEYINRNKAKYFDWKSTRLTEKQAHRIKQLQGRLTCCDGCTSYTCETVEGNQVCCFDTCKAFAKAVKDKAILSDIQLIQFSKEQAGKYIDQLTKETNDKELKKSTLSYETISDKDCRNKTTSMNEEDRRKEINSCVYKLYASIGQEVEEELINQFSFSNLIDLIQLTSFYKEPESIINICENILTEEIICGIIDNDIELIEALVKNNDTKIA